MALVPPHDAQGDHIYWWRVAMAGTLGGLVMSFAIHVAWACGFLTVIGLDGFARANDVAALGNRLSFIEAGQVRAEILTTRTIQCRTIKNGDQNALAIITRDLQDALDRYQTITHKQYQLPDCDAL